MCALKLSVLTVTGAPEPTGRRQERSRWSDAISPYVAVLLGEGEFFNYCCITHTYTHRGKNSCDILYCAGSRIVHLLHRYPTEDLHKELNKGDKYILASHFLTEADYN